MKRIPISAAAAIAKAYGYEQVVVIARKTGEADVAGEHVTTYGVNKAHCAAAAQIGNFLKHKVMGWPGSIELHVIMGNDYPEAVFSNKGAAEAFCAYKKKHPVSGEGGTGTRIYWRVHSFPLDGTVLP